MLRWWFLLPLACALPHDLVPAHFKQQEVLQKTSDQCKFTLETKKPGETAWVSRVIQFTWSTVRGSSVTVSIDGVPSGSISAGQVSIGEADSTSTFRQTSSSGIVEFWFSDERAGSREKKPVKKQMEVALLVDVFVQNCFEIINRDEQKEGPPRFRVYSVVRPTGCSWRRGSGACASETFTKEELFELWRTELEYVMHQEQKEIKANLHYLKGRILKIVVWPEWTWRYNPDQLPLSLADKQWVLTSIEEHLTKKLASLKDYWIIPGSIYYGVKMTSRCPHPASVDEADTCGARRETNSLSDVKLVQNSYAIFNCLYHFDTVGGEVRVGPRHCKAHECENRQHRERWGRCATQFCNLKFDDIKEEDFAPSLTRMGDRFMGVDICLDHLANPTSNHLHSGKFQTDSVTGKKVFEHADPLPAIQVIVSNGMDMREIDVDSNSALFFAPWDHVKILPIHRQFYEVRVDFFGTTLTPYHLPSWRVQPSGFVVLCDGNGLGPEDGAGLRQVKIDKERRRFVREIAILDEPQDALNNSMWKRAKKEHELYENGYIGSFDLQEAFALVPVVSSDVYTNLAPMNLDSNVQAKFDDVLQELDRFDTPVIRESKVYKMPLLPIKEVDLSESAF